MSQRATMEGFQAISGGSAECYITLDGRRYNMMNAKNLEATAEKVKTEIPVLGRKGEAHKSSTWKGTGNADFYFNSSLFREIFMKFVKTGKDTYFDMQVTNEDVTSGLGRQTTILKNCNLDSTVLAKFAAGGEPLEESVNFTFDDCDLPESFSELPGM